jgi:hypothetical protein
MRIVDTNRVRIRGAHPGTGGVFRSTDPRGDTMPGHDDATTGPTTDPQGDTQTHLDTDPSNQADASSDPAGGTDPAGAATGT